MTNPGGVPETGLVAWDALKAAGDNALMEQVVLGNDDAFAVIVERYQRLVYSVALRFVGDRNEAEDVVQIAFLDAFRAKGQFDPAKGTLKMWLLQYAYTRAINRVYHLKQRRFFSNVNVNEIKPLEYSTARSEDRWLNGPEASRYLDQALGQLRRKERAAVQLIAIEGLQIQEAADKLGQTLPKTRHDYYRAIVKLKKMLLPQADERAEQPATKERSDPQGGKLEVRNYVGIRASRTI